MMSVVSGLAIYKLPRRTHGNGTLQFTNQTQDEALIPWTINSVITSRSTFAAFPHLAELPRSTAEAEAQGVNALINLSSRPTGALPTSPCATGTTGATCGRRSSMPRSTCASTRFRRRSRRVLGLSSTTRATSSMPTCRLHPRTGWGPFRVGYGREDVERQGRGFADVGENIFRLAYDAYANQYFTVRASFDVGRRRGSGFVETGIDYETGPGGTQPTLRYYDEADRDRHARVAVMLTVMPARDGGRLLPVSPAAVTSSCPIRRCRSSRPGELFGLHESDGDQLERRRQRPSERDGRGLGAQLRARSRSVRCNARATRTRRRIRLDGSKPRLDARQRRQGEQLRPLSRPAAAAPEHRYPLRLRLQRFGQQLRARRARASPR